MAGMGFHFQVLHKTREQVVDLINSLTEEELNRIPEQYNNNILWNAGHILASYNGLVYKLSGLNDFIPTELIQPFKKGSKPETRYDDALITSLKDHLINTVSKVTEDYNNGVFKQYMPYETMTEVRLISAEEAIAFCNVHEGVHYGYMLSQKKVIQS